MEYLSKKNRKLRNTFAIPIVSSLIIPIIIMDICMEIYHRICFPIYRIPLIKRSNYIQIDRYKLRYLSFVQKIYCAYCGYSNGVINYWAKIGAETEKYWCGIKHKQNSDFMEPHHHKDFAEYSDKEDFKKKYAN